MVPMTTNNTFNEKPQHYRWTYRWFVPGFDDDIYWDSVTFEWWENGVPSQEFILNQIKEQHNLSDSDINTVEIAGLPHVEKIQ